jgi:hypothetical protein
MTDVSGNYIPDGGENRRDLRAVDDSLSDEDRRLGLKSATEAEEQEAA